MAITGSETKVPPAAAIKVTEVESVKCDSCGFTEECTPAYISRVRERYQGRWICGLCAEAVKDEVIRSEKMISIEEALNRHIEFCNDFRSSSPTSSDSEHPISAIGRLLRRSLDSPMRAIRSNSTSSILRDVDVDVDEVRRPSLIRSESCIPYLSR